MHVESNVQSDGAHLLSGTFLGASLHGVVRSRLEAVVGALVRSTVR